MLLAQNNEVVAVDIIKDKVKLLNLRQSPIQYKEISELLSNHQLNFKTTLDATSTYSLKLIL